MSRWDACEASLVYFNNIEYNVELKRRGRLRSFTGPRLVYVNPLELVTFYLRPPLKM